ncbi:leucyl/phenylalanyl-tRNA--protein transferase [Sphingomonas sp.]
MTRRLSLYQQIDPEMLLRAYAMGVFPMADHRDAPGVYWVEPRLRGILPLEGFQMSRSLARTIRRDRFRVTADRAFDAIVGLCAQSAPDRPETWINPPIAHVFARLHDLGFAHSIECWEGDRLVGGLYGLALGRAFFGESMVSRATDASKVALAWLVARLRVGGFTLLDCQFQTDHLRSLGAIEISRDDYMALLGSALGEDSAGLDGGFASVSASFDALDRLDDAPPLVASLPMTTVSGPVSGKDIVQLLGHTSQIGCGTTLSAGRSR